MIFRDNLTQSGKLTSQLPFLAWQLARLASREDNKIAFRGLRTCNNMSLNFPGSPTNDDRRPFSSDWHAKEE